MKYFYIILLFLVFSCTQKEPLPLNVIPLPNEYQVSKGSFPIEESISIGYNHLRLQKVANQFSVKGINVTTQEYEEANVKLKLIESESNESYKLEINADEILITASTPKGIFYGLQSLKQMILFSPSSSSIQLPLVSISDSPRFGWRGLMLDESRYFFGVDKVKELLDLMALHKLNVFHWHLTDVPGWRIEIKQYPLLATVGGLGNDIDRDASAKYYTQEEIKEIVQYAADRFIEVIPEIDMPGHARAANRAYPEFSGGGSKSHPEFTFNPGYEGTYTYLTNILKEVKTLFPSEYLHLGGDEVHYGNANWKVDKHVQELMKKKGFTDLREVESYFIHRMTDSISALGQTVIGWDEIADFGVSPENSLLMWWRHDRTYILEDAFTKNYDFVLCPRIPLYFDFDQHESHQYGRKTKFGDFSPLEMVHAFPPDTLFGVKEHYSQIKGIQANIWSERIQDEDRLDYLTHPRLSALAEAAWTQAEHKDMNDFNRRLKPMLKHLEERGIVYFNPFNPELTPEPVGLFRRNLEQKKKL